MTEEQIRAGYDRMDGALAPPLDAALRVERRVATRRRRRRTAVAGVASLGVLAVGGSVAALASGDDGRGPTVATESTDPVSTLVMTRPDGSTYAFVDVTLRCDDTGTRITARSPRHIEGRFATQPFVQIEGVVADLRGGRSFDLPLDGPGGSDTFPLTVFVADSEGTNRSNEASSPELSSAGTVRVVRAACEPAPVLELEVDATLGSEVRQDTLDLAGALR